MLACREFRKFRKVLASVGPKGESIDLFVELPIKNKIGLFCSKR